jgi:integral membrane sensor domain MASE1
LVPALLVFLAKSRLFPVGECGSAPDFMKRKWFLTLVQVLAVAAVYLAAARNRLVPCFSERQRLAVWPATGVAIAAVWWLGYRVSPGVFLGALVANLLTRSAPTAVAAIAGNTLEAVTAVFLLYRFVGLRSPFNRAGDFLKFIVWRANR